MKYILSLCIICTTFLSCQKEDIDIETAVIDTAKIETDNGYIIISEKILELNNPITSTKLISELREYNTGIYGTHGTYNVIQNYDVIAIANARKESDMLLSAVWSVFDFEVQEREYIEDQILGE